MGGDDSQILHVNVPNHTRSKILRSDWNPWVQSLERGRLWVAIIGICNKDTVPDAVKDGRNCRLH